MKILLTGSEGFVGQHLQSHLKNKHQIMCLDKKTGNDLLTCDLNYEVDLVIHLAGLSGVKDSLQNPCEYWSNNVVAGQRLFSFFKNTRILYASSSTAYEPWRNPYALSKFGLETIAPKNSLGMRFTTIYGPNAKPNMLIPKILNKQVTYINLNHTRDFIHISDVLGVIDLLIENDLSGVLDIGTGQSHSLLDIINYCNIDCKKVICDETERLDNKADLTILNKYNWKSKINLFDYIKENYDIN